MPAVDDDARFRGSLLRMYSDPQRGFEPLIRATPRGLLLSLLLLAA